MDGIVLWADPKTHKAVIWCSDHADLAYASASSLKGRSFQMPEAGTMVQCETRLEDGVRVCVSLRAIQRDVAPDLAQALRDITSKPAA